MTTEQKVLKAVIERIYSNNKEFQARLERELGLEDVEPVKIEEMVFYHPTRDIVSVKGNEVKVVYTDIRGRELEPAALENDLGAYPMIGEVVKTPDGIYKVEIWSTKGGFYAEVSKIADKGAKIIARRRRQ